MSDQIRFCLRVHTQARLGASILSDVFYPLPPTGKLVIGSDPGSWLYLNEPYVLPRHLEIDCSADGYQITYLGPEDGAGAFQRDSQVSLPTGIALPFQLNDEIRLGFIRLILEELVEEQPITVAETLATPQATIPMRIRPYQGEIPPGLNRLSTLFLQNLPEIYQPSFAFSSNKLDLFSGAIDTETFLSRFLALFESVFLPLEWVIDNFDFYLDIDTSPKQFIPWLQQWYVLTFEDSWDVEQREKMLKQAHRLFALRGSKWALAYMLETFSRGNVDIDESDAIGAHTFRVKIQGGRSDLSQEEIRRWINIFKPAHTICDLQWIQ